MVLVVPGAWDHQMVEEEEEDLLPVVEVSIETDLRMEGRDTSLEVHLLLCHIVRPDLREIITGI